VRLSFPVDVCDEYGVKIGSTRIVEKRRETPGSDVWILLDEDGVAYRQRNGLGVVRADQPPTGDAETVPNIPAGAGPA
jgi:hypothetical protein